MGSCVIIGPLIGSKYICDASYVFKLIFLWVNINFNLYIFLFLLYYYIHTHSGDCDLICI